MSGLIPNTIKKLVTPTTVQSAAIWGGTAAITAIWMTQPFDYMKSLIEGEKKEDS